MPAAAAGKHASVEEPSHQAHCWPAALLSSGCSEREQSCDHRQYQQWVPRNGFLAAFAADAGLNTACACRAQLPCFLPISWILEGTAQFPGDLRPLTPAHLLTGGASHGGCARGLADQWREGPQPVLRPETAGMLACGLCLPHLALVLWCRTRFRSTCRHRLLAPLACIVEQEGGAVSMAAPWRPPLRNSNPALMAYQASD